MPSTDSTFIIVATSHAVHAGHKAILGPSNANNQVFIGTRDGNFSSFYGGPSTWSNVLANSPTAPISDNQPRILVSIQNSGETSYVNGTQLTSEPTDLMSIPINDNLYLGLNSTALEQNWDGDVAEVIIFNRALKIKELNVIEKYLSQKYGIAIAD